MPRTELIRVSDTKPSLMARAWEYVRSYTIGPLTSRSPELAKYFSGGGPSLSGVSVTERNADTVSAVWAAVGLIADDVSSLPLMLYKRLPNGGKDKFEDHPLYRLLHDEPNPEMGSMVFRRTLQAHACIWQNAYAEIERDMVGRPIALWPLIPENVSVQRNRIGGLEYLVNTGNNARAVIPAADMLHLVGRSHDGTVGCSLVDKARESLGLALASEQFGATFFGNGASIGGVISFPGPKPTEMSDENYRAQLEARHQGVKRAHKILALYNGAKFDQTSVAPNNAQFLETRTFQIREVARWFKIPPHKLADLADATFSNVEQMNTEYFVSAIRPWLVLWEQELSRKLINRLERRQQFIEHSIEGFLRGDSTARSAFYTALFNIGAITINEVRGYENLDPLAGGDQAFVQVNNLMPLSKVNAYSDAVIEAQKAPKAPLAPPKPNDGASTEVKEALEAVEKRIAEQGERLIAEASARATAEALAAEKAQQVEALRAETEDAARTIAARDQALVELEAIRVAQIGMQLDKTAGQIVDLERQWQAERDGLLQQRDVAQAEKNDLDVMLGTAERERDEAKARAVLADAALADREAALVLERAEAATAVTRAQQTATGRLQAILIAHRALIVDAVERLLQRESDRARKAQATPEKLRAWTETFYQTHAETCRTVLRPVVLAWAPCAGVNPDQALAELVQSHIDTSRRDLQIAADTEDGDELSANLARVLRRWETERAQSVADRLMAEGDRYGH